ncbi:MAG: glycosidase related protein [Frankiales bacterium]|nr:glycosidase related protein [Frankiales bacterium]
MNAGSAIRVGGDDPDFVRRLSPVLQPDPARVITKLFLPGQEILARGISRADAVIQRVLAMSEDQVSLTLAATLADFGGRHHDLTAIFAEHYKPLAHRTPGADTQSAERQALIGAYCTQEYSIEAAALFNPSMVAHPDQSGLNPGELRFVMSVRAVGEGHISSIEFRTGVLGSDDLIEFDAPGQHPHLGGVEPAVISREFLRRALAERISPVDDETATYVLSLLPDSFIASDLGNALASVTGDRLTQGSADDVLEHVRAIVSSNYRLSFDPNRPLSERVIYPASADESHGVEDARFTCFVEDDGSSRYLGTYTAYDGSKVAPRLLETVDFSTFDSTRLTGPAAKNKGMALFPRRVGGQFRALSRWDRESIGVASSSDAVDWSNAVTVKVPEQPWELIQLGNCGPPIETEQGWLVLTHGVGPMRVYGIGAMLLDLDDPTSVLGVLDQPILTPTPQEREGYVPNVVYSCGALTHGTDLVVPYGCSDSSIRIALVDLPELLKRLLTR